MRTRKRIPLSTIAQDAIRANPDAYAVMTKLACRGIVVLLRANGELFYAETKGISSTFELYRAFKAQTAGLTAICAAAGLRRFEDGATA